jgi:hypothetical protein
MPIDAFHVPDRGEIVIYQPPEGGPRLELHLERDTIWLDAHQMASLFERDRTVIVRHIRNIYATGELARESTCAKNAQVAADGRLRQMDLYNLDMVISVGYRVNSRLGTQFRIWATNVLRDHLIHGYSSNERRLRELRLSLRMVEHALDETPVTADEAAALVRLVTDYSYALDLLDDYDHQRVTSAPTFAEPAIGISYEEALAIIAQLRERFGARRIANNALVAMTLLIAISEPGEKPVIINMIVNLINGRN